MNGLKEFNYESENHYNLVAFAILNQLMVTEESPFKVEYQDYHDRYKVSLGGYAWLVAKDYIGKFWLAIDKMDDEAQGFIDRGNGAENKNVRMTATGPVNELTYTYTDTTFGQLTGEDFLNVEKRMEGLITASAQVIREVAEKINKEQSAVAKDTSVVKDFDGILTFDTKLGKDFGVSLCFDKIPPVRAGNSDVFIERTPMTKEDGEMYMRETYAKVNERLAFMNGLVRDFMQAKAVQKDEFLVKYAETLVNGTLAHAYLNQNVIYISFGGEDRWGTLDKDTENNVKCLETLDQEVEKIIQLLDGIEKTEGVDIYSLDIDTFAIFGRNFDNRVVTPALQGYTQKLLDNYSKGFEQCLSTRLMMIDNQHFFKA